MSWVSNVQGAKVYMALNVLGVKCPRLQMSWASNVQGFKCLGRQMSRGPKCHISKHVYFLRTGLGQTFMSVTCVYEQIHGKKGKLTMLKTYTSNCEILYALYLNINTVFMLAEIQSM